MPVPKPGATVEPLPNVGLPLMVPKPLMSPRPAVVTAGPNDTPPALSMAPASTLMLCVKPLLNKTSSPPVLLLMTFKPTGTFAAHSC